MDTDNLKLMLQLAARLGASGHAVAVDNLISLMKTGQEDHDDGQGTGHSRSATAVADQCQGNAVFPQAEKVTSSEGGRGYSSRFLCDLERELLSSAYQQGAPAAASMGFHSNPNCAPQTERLGPVFPGPAPFPDQLSGSVQGSVIVKREGESSMEHTGLVDAKSASHFRQQDVASSTGAPRPPPPHFSHCSDSAPLDLSQTMHNHFVRVSDVPIPSTVSNIMNLPGRSRDRFVERALSTCNYVNRLERQFLLRQENSGPGRKFSDHFRQAIFCVPSRDCRLPKFTKLADDSASRDLLAQYQSVGCGFPAGCINETVTQYRKIDIPTLLSEKDFQRFLQRLYPRYSGCHFELFIITKCRSLLPADVATPIWLKSIKYQGVLIVVPTPDDTSDQNGYKLSVDAVTPVLPPNIKSESTTDGRQSVDSSEKSDRDVVHFFQSSVEAGQERVKSILQDHSSVTASANQSPGREVCPLNLVTLVDVFLLEILTRRRQYRNEEFFQQLPASVSTAHCKDWTWNLMTCRPLSLHVRGFLLDALPDIEDVAEMLRAVQESDSTQQGRSHCIYALFKGGLSDVGVKYIHASELHEHLKDNSDVTAVWQSALDVAALTASLNVQ